MVCTALLLNHASGVNFQGGGHPPTSTKGQGETLPAPCIRSWTCLLCVNSHSRYSFPFNNFKSAFYSIPFRPGRNILFGEKKKNPWIPLLEYNNFILLVYTRHLNRHFLSCSFYSKLYRFDRKF